MKKRKKRNRKIKKINKKNRPDGKKRYALYLQTGRKYIKGVSLLLIPLGLIAVLGVYSYYFLCTSPVFYLNQIKVKTNGRMDEAAVKRYAGLNDKTRIFKLRPDSISRKLQSLPQVKRA
ncbi:MAG: FtsQ-type POTRA domain-containing protein, partial [Candidatus Omnitrophota bacterium]|nr:FtsQ-type POTRA domain-containing protein [Candidatus Omnitrophota bacterium]